MVYIAGTVGSGVCKPNLWRDERSEEPIASIHNFDQNIIIRPYSIYLTPNQHSASIYVYIYLYMRLCTYISKMAIFEFLPNLYIATWGKKYLPKTLILFSQSCHHELKRARTSLNWVIAPNSAVLASESQFY